MISVSLWLWWYDRAWQCLCSCFSSSSFLKLSSVLKLAPKLWIGGPSCAPHSRAMPASFPSPTGGSGIWIFLMMTTSWRPWLYFQVWEVHLRSVIHTLVRHPHQLPGRGHHQQVGHHNHHNHHNSLSQMGRLSSWRRHFMWGGVTEWSPGHGSVRHTGRPIIQQAVRLPFHPWR